MHEPTRSSPNRLGIAAFLLAAAIALPTCAVKLISSYDEATDKAVTALQTKTESHLVALDLESVEGLPECEYESSTPTYFTKLHSTICV